MSNPNPELEENDYFWWVVFAALLFALLLKMCPVLNQLIMGY